MIIKSTTGGEPEQVEIVQRTDAAAIFASVVTLAANAYVAMLALGGLHSHYVVIPAVSYLDALLGGLVLGAVSSAMRPPRRTWTKSRKASR